MQTRDHIHCSSSAAAIYYTTVGLEKSNREQTDRQRTEKAIKEATLIVDGSSG